MVHGKDTEMMVSVIMITYGHEKYIEEAINGVFIQQTDFPVELIIANDCSPDQTDEVVKLLLRRAPENITVRYTKHQTNKGMNANFLWAASQATGKYIALCEGDDYWTDPLKLQKQVDFLEENEEYVLTFHPVKIKNPDGSLVDDFITEVPANYELQETLASGDNYIHTPSVVFRNIIKVFPPEFSLSPIGDYFLYMILTEHGKMKMQADYMAVYRYGVGIFSSQSNIKRAKSSVSFHSLLLAWSSNTDLNKFFIRKNDEAVSYLEEIIRDEYAGKLATDHILVRALNVLRNPQSIWRKLKQKL